MPSAWPLAKRLAHFTDKSAGPDGCWPWTGWKDARGYGRLWDGAKQTLTHRIAWAIAHGSIPAGLHVCHRCDNPACVNVAHLFLGTHADNMADKKAKGRQAKGDALARAVLSSSAFWANTPRGAAHTRPNAKLTPADVIAIRASTESNRALAERYGLHKETVGQIRRRQRWAHI